MQPVRNCHTCGIRYTANEQRCPDDDSALVESNDEMLGTMIGNYRVVRMLGEGGMGQVYLALNPRIGSRVAIKVLSEVASTDSVLVERFFAEAHSVNMIRHEGIVNVLDLDHLPDGRPFITMEHLLGEPLNTSLSRGPLALGTAAGIVIEILDALQAAHDAGVVHRDLKPDNLFLSPQGRVKVLDFGVAKLMPHYDASLAKAATQTGALIGTPGYMSPEQVVGDPVTASTDLYAVGAILYEMVTGQMAFRGSSLFELFNRIVNDPPAAPTDRRPELAGPYQDFIMKALSKSPGDRHGSAREMAEDLKAVSALLGPRDWTPVRGLGTPSAHPMQADTIGQSQALRPGLRTGLPDDADTREDQQSPPSQDETRDVVGSPMPTAGLHSVAAMDTGAATVSRKSSRWPLMLALTALFAGSVSAIVLGAGAAKSTAASAAAVDLESDGGGLVAQAGQDRLVLPPAVPGQGLDAGSQASGTPTEAGKKKPRSSHKGVDKSKKAPPPAPADKKTEVDSKKPTVEVAPNGDVITKHGGVTLIETGNRHADKQIHLKPNFNPKSFEAASYAAKARALAKKIYPDVRLVTFDVPGVAPTGYTNLQMANFEATYNFLSPSHSKRTLPIGVEEDRPCWVYVEVNKKGVTARIVEWDECKGKRRPNPKCSLKQVWDRAKDQGAPASGAVAAIDYLHDGWFFSIDALGISMSIPDDC